MSSATIVSSSTRPAPTSLRALKRGCRRRVGTGRECTAGQGKGLFGAGAEAAIGLLEEVGVAAAGAGLPAARPMLGAAEPLIGEFVVNLTCGTVTWVESTEVVDELGMGEPDEIPVE